jgi:hypothetical protein
MGLRRFMKIALAEIQAKVTFSRQQRSPFQSLRLLRIVLERMLTYHREVGWCFFS